MRSVKFILSAFVAFICLSAPAIAAVSAPEISDGLVWMNSGRPLKISDLQGKFVVLYFWSYSGGNLQSVVDQCRELQEKFPTQVVVIGIHEGKALSNDQLNDRVADALSVYRIAHPVAIDDQMLTLRAFRLNSLPSAVLIAPDGSVLFKKIGDENLFYFFNSIILKNLPRFEDRLNNTVLDFQKLPVVQPSAEIPNTTTTIPGELSTDVKSLENTVLSSGENEPGVSTGGAGPGYSNVSGPSINDMVEMSTEAPAVLNTKKFLGSTTAIDREYSQKVAQVAFNLTLPADAQLLGADKSFVRVWSDDHTVVGQKYIRDRRTEIAVNREFSGKEMYIEVTLYYCTHGQKALCRIKNELFVVPLAPYLKWETIEIHSNIPENGS